MFIVAWKKAFFSFFEPNVCSCFLVQSEGGPVGPSLQRGVGSVWYPSDGPGHGAPVHPPPAPCLHRGQPGAGLHRADGRGLPAAPTHTGSPASPGDPGYEREQVDENHFEGADRCPEGQENP